MNPENVNSIVGIILSLVPFVLVGGWLAYRHTKSRPSLPPRAARTKQTVPRFLVVEKATGKQAIVTVCGFAEDSAPAAADLKKLPDLVKVRYRMENGIFSAADSDWLSGENFAIVKVIQVEELEP